MHYSFTVLAAEALHNAWPCRKCYAALSSADEAFLTIWRRSIWPQLSCVLPMLCVTIVQHWQPLPTGS